MTRFPQTTQEALQPTAKATLGPLAGLRRPLAGRKASPHPSGLPAWRRTSTAVKSGSQERASWLLMAAPARPTPRRRGHLRRSHPPPAAATKWRLSPVRALQAPAPPRRSPPRRAGRGPTLRAKDRPSGPGQTLRAGPCTGQHGHRPGQRPRPPPGPAKARGSAAQHRRPVASAASSSGRTPRALSLPGTPFYFFLFFLLFYLFSPPRAARWGRRGGGREGGHGPRCGAPRGAEGRRREEERETEGRVKESKEERKTRDLTWKWGTCAPARLKRGARLAAGTGFGRARHRGTGELLHRLVPRTGGKENPRHRHQCKWEGTVFFTRTNRLFFFPPGNPLSLQSGATDASAGWRHPQ